MRVMLLAFASTIAIAVVAHVALDEIGFSSKEKYASENVRLGD